MLGEQIWILSAYAPQIIKKFWKNLDMITQRILLLEKLSNKEDLKGRRERTWRILKYLGVLDIRRGMKKTT